MTTPRAAARILKLAKAQRQLDAAIKTTFAGDHGAITTVAGAAYRLLRDRKTKRGPKSWAGKCAMLFWGQLVPWLEMRLSIVFWKSQMAFEAHDE